MKQDKVKNIELRVVRSNSFVDGKVLEYLFNHPSGRPATELAMEAITSYWIEEALDQPTSEKYFLRACQIATQNLKTRLQLLEDKIKTINPILDRDEKPIDNVIANQQERIYIKQAQENNSDTILEGNSHIEQEDNWELDDILPSEEIIAANKLMEFKNK